MTAWHATPIPQVFEELSSHEQGLTNAEAVRRLGEDGPNALPEGKQESVLARFLRQFQSPLIYLLLAAAAVIFAIGETIDGFVTLGVLLFNAVVGTIQEGRAENTLLALKRFAENSASVIRDGKELIIPDREVVMGDILVLQEGEAVAADARLVAANILKVDEASLTGESVPVLKTTLVLNNLELPLPERKNMVFKGTHVVMGNGVAVVVASGGSTEIGKIAREIESLDTEIPLKTKIRHLSKLIILAVLAIDAALILYGVAAGESMKDMFVTSVALAISIIPEGLPIVITLVLASGVWRMSKRKALVKRLQAVEALGDTRVIAVDKTGTLTKNEIVALRAYVDGATFTVEGAGYEPKGDILLDGQLIAPLNHEGLIMLGKLAAFSSNARLSWSEEKKIWKVAGDPTEAAMLVFAEKIGFRREILEQESPKLFELPFDYQRNYHATVRTVEGKRLLAVAGAPEAILKIAHREWKNGEFVPLRDTERARLESLFLEFAHDGFRVVGFAIHPDADEIVDPLSLPPLAFAGFLAMRDGLRPEVRQAVASVKEAGMRVVMITGDHRLTAEAIGKEAGIYAEGDRTLTGESIEAMSDTELAKALETTTVCARVTPEHKLRIIKNYQRRGEIVAMTGDGVNDAPSLVAADLGVAMGTIGTDVAKEAADIVLMDDNFGSIVAAVEEGRNIYRAIRKVILYLLSTSLGEAFTIVGALMVGFPIPLLPAQIIWLNFVTDGFLDIALALEYKDHDPSKNRPGPPGKWIVDRNMIIRMAVMAIPMAIGTLVLFGEYIASEPAKASSIALTTLAIFQWMNAWNCRSEKKSVFRIPLTNTLLTLATGIVFALQLAALYTPFLQNILHTVPLSFAEWMAAAGIALTVVLAEEIRKVFARTSSFEKNL